MLKELFNESTNNVLEFAKIFLYIEISIKDNANFVSLIENNRFCSELLKKVKSGDFSAAQFVVNVRSENFSMNNFLTNFVNK